MSQSHPEFCNFIHTRRACRISDSAHLLQTTREEARHALEWSGDGDDLLSEVVEDVDGEGAQRATALPAQAVVLFDGVEHVLTHGVADFVLVVAFKTDEGCVETNNMYEDGTPARTGSTGEVISISMFYLLYLQQAQLSV